MASGLRNRSPSLSTFSSPPLKRLSLSSSPSRPLPFKTHFLSPLCTRPFPLKTDFLSPFSPLPSPVNRHSLSSMRTVATVKRSPKRLKYSAPRFTKGEGFLYVNVDPQGADTWKLDPVVRLLQDGAVGVITTDTVYAIVCDLKSHSSIERLRRIKDIDSLKPLSILCHSLKDIDTYTLGFPCGNGQGQTNIFRAVKHCLPGPYTFILPASKELPKQCLRYGTSTAKYASRKSVGVRIPDDIVCQAILEKMGRPLICTSVKWPKEDEWIVDPAIIADVYAPEPITVATLPSS
ncbi:hypothetical protein AMTRI_Chr06g172060 [Amborella trichopoda]